MYEYEQYRNNKIIKSAEAERKKCKHPYVGTEHLVLALLKLDEIKEICDKHNLTYEIFKNALMKVVGSSKMETNFILHTPLLKMVVTDSVEDSNGEVNPKNLFISVLENGDGIAIRILMGMNIKLDKLYNDLKNNISNDNIDFGINLNKSVDLTETISGRDKEIDLMIETLLRKNKSNPILVGPAGVGKTAIVEELARRLESGKVPERLKGKKIISLEMFNLVAGTKYRGEFEEKIKNILDMVKQNKNIILFIDEIHTIVNAGGSEGAIDAANILKPYLSRGDIKVIGATTIYEYNKYIKTDKALERRFQLIKVDEPSLSNTIEILDKSKKVYEKFYGIKITKSNVKDIVLNADRYIKYKKNPDKSLEILDLLCSKLCLKEKLVIEKKDIINLFEEICNTKVDNADYKQLYLKLNEKIVGQVDISDKIINVLKINSDKPKSMLFCGNSGVGKSASAKIISDELNYNLVRIDMSEFINDTSIHKLIGVPNGYQGSDSEFILESVRFNPKSLILVDEVEKGSKRVLNLFLNILDEGYIKDSKGEIIDFSHSIIIFTSNLKRECGVGFFDKKVNNKFFSNEFVFRLDEIIYFNDINEEMISEYLIRHNSELSSTDVVNNCDYKKLGFRAVEKFIKNNKVR